MSFCRMNNGFLTVSLHVQARAKKTEIIGIHDGNLKLRVAAPPVDGAANDEIIKYFAQLFSIARAQIEILHGDKSKKKVLQVNGLTESEFTDVLLKKGLLTIKLA